MYGKMLSAFSFFRILINSSSGRNYITQQSKSQHTSINPLVLQILTSHLKIKEIFRYI